MTSTEPDSTATAIWPPSWRTLKRVPVTRTRPISVSTMKGWDASGDTSSMISPPGCNVTRRSERV
ncbi:hypothetical protein WJ970_14500 [Achromobacter xylosoxidans]